MCVVTAGYIGWVIFTFTFVLNPDQKRPPSKSLLFEFCDPRGVTFLGVTSFLFGGYLLFFGFPVTYYLYCFFTLLIWANLVPLFFSSSSSSSSSSSFPSIFSLFSLNERREGRGGRGEEGWWGGVLGLVGGIVGLEMVMSSYHDREMLMGSVVVMLVVYWGEVWWGRKREDGKGVGKRWDLVVFSGCCLGVCSFLFFPVDGGEMPWLVGVGGGRRRGGRGGGVLVGCSSL